MASLKRRFSFKGRRKVGGSPVSVHPSSAAHPWDEDRRNVLAAGASFPVKYLGSVAVPSSRGVEVCMQAVQSLPYGKNKKKMLLNISTDGIRIVEMATKSLVVDQPIQKISFCSPDQQNDRIFSYIAREGSTRRWICHVFVAFKGSTGERLSHAMGCAFAACLRKKEQEKSMSQSSSPTSLSDGSTHQIDLEQMRSFHQVRQSSVKPVKQKYESLESLESLEGLNAQTSHVEIMEAELHGDGKLDNVIQGALVPSYNNQTSTPDSVVTSVAATNDPWKSPHTSGGIDSVLSASGAYRPRPRVPLSTDADCASTLPPLIAQFEDIPAITDSAITTAQLGGELFGDEEDSDNRLLNMFPVDSHHFYFQ